MSAARPLPFSLVKAQLRRSLRACHRAQALHRADVDAGTVAPRAWSSLTASERAAYRRRAEVEQVAPPARRDVVVMRDQITRAERARILRFGGSRC